MKGMARTHVPTGSASAWAFAPLPAGLLQRKCACGGSPGPVGECEACRGKPRLQGSRPSTLAWGLETRGPILFDRGRFAPGTPAGRRLLAHELTHVVQQAQAADTASAADSERDADRAAESVAAGGAAGAVSGAPVTLQRQEATPPVSDEEGEADREELACNIAALCRLRRTAPTVVTDARVRAAARSCRPDILLTMDPCLMPAFLLPPSAFVPTPTPGTAAGPGPRTAAPAAGGGGGLGGLAELTSFRFNFGPAQFNVDLPSSVAVRLPVPFRGARLLEFNLSAETSGSFSFSVRVDRIPHVRIEARAGVEVGERARATAGLTITTTRTVCRAMEASTAREQLQSKGEALREAIQNLYSPPPAEPGTRPPVAAERLGDVASAISELYDTVERSRARCREVPVATLGITGETPLGEEARERPSRVGATLTLHF